MGCIKRNEIIMLSSQSYPQRYRYLLLPGLALYLLGLFFLSITKSPYLNLVAAIGNTVLLVLSYLYFNKTMRQEYTGDVVLRKVDTTFGVFELILFAVPVLSFWRKDALFFILMYALVGSIFLLRRLMTRYWKPIAIVLQGDMLMYEVHIKRDLKLLRSIKLDSFANNVTLSFEGQGNLPLRVVDYNEAELYQFLKACMAASQQPHIDLSDNLKADLAPSP
jgi:hypothetical protein